MANGTHQESQQLSFVRSNDFRYLPCDSFNLGISDAGVRLILGINQLDGTVCELAGVQMNIETAVALLSVLQKSLEEYETQSGSKILPTSAAQS